MKVVLGVLFAFCLLTSGLPKAEPELLAEWVTLAFDWESVEQRDSYIADGRFIEDNNIITGVKAYQGEIYLTVPRWRTGVPSTLNKLVYKNGKHLLQPYPNWEMQSLDNGDGIRYVQSMEIDSRGWMWILDVGRLYFLGDPDEVVNGPPKLVIWDIEKDCKIREYVFPDYVLPWNNSFANDIVVDETNGFAYISDTAADGGIVTYDFNLNIARRWDDETLQGNPDNVEVINGVKYHLPQPSDGIALSHDTKTLYYCPLSVVELYSVPTAFLQNFSLPDAQISKHVEKLGLSGYSDGMAFTNDSKLYFGSTEENAVESWDTRQGTIISVETVASNATTMMWPDTFGFGDHNNLLFTTNRLPEYVTNTMDYSGGNGPNQRLFSVDIGAGPYLTGDPQPPSLPCLV